MYVYMCVCMYIWKRLASTRKNPLYLKEQLPLKELASTKIQWKPIILVGVVSFSRNMELHGTNHSIWWR